MNWFFRALFRCDLPMSVESIRRFCLSFSHATENPQWGDDLCFKVGGKIFALLSLTAGWPRFVISQAQLALRVAPSFALRKGGWQGDGTIGTALRRVPKRNLSSTTPILRRRHPAISGIATHHLQKTQAWGTHISLRGRQTADKGGPLAPCHLRDLTPTLSLG